MAVGEKVGRRGGETWGGMGNGWWVWGGSECGGVTRYPCSLSSDRSAKTDVTQFFSTEHCVPLLALRRALVMNATHLTLLASVSRPQTVKPSRAGSLSSIAFSVCTEYKVVCLTEVSLGRERESVLFCIGLSLRILPSPLSLSVRKL